eukprot:scaffold95726_cov21-Tisochrysis_lutea.AAC.2
MGCLGRLQATLVDGLQSKRLTASLGLDAFDVALQAAGVSISDLPASERCFELALMVEQLQHTIGMTAKLQARITQLEQQQAGHEEEVEKLGRTKQKMEQALEEALVGALDEPEIEK